MMNQLSSLVSQSLKTDYLTMPSGIDWDVLKRTPQKLRLKIIKDGSSTVDEDFDTLELEFSLLKQSIILLMKFSEKFHTSFVTVLEASQQISISLTKFFDPYNSFRQDEQSDDGFILWEVIH